MISTSDLNEAKKLIRKEKKPVIIRARSDEFNRKALEQLKFDILLSPESGNKKDTLRQLDSGFNEVMASIAKKKNTALGIDIKEIKSLDKRQKAIRLAKLKQNIMLCNKFGVKLAVNSQDKRNAMSLLISLGASTKQAKEAIFFE